MSAEHLYHHCCSLSVVRYGLVTPRRLGELSLSARSCSPSKSCELDAWHYARSMGLAYEWLAAETGFHPLFLGVGAAAGAWSVTGYRDQFGDESTGRAKVLFSYRRRPRDLVFNDYEYWHLVLGKAFQALQNLGGGRHTRTLRTLPDSARQRVLKPEWSGAQWLRQARLRPGTVQAVVPSLDLAVADRVWAPDAATRDCLLGMGFPRERVLVRRVSAAPRSVSVPSSF